jgi:Fic family protein
MRTIVRNSAYIWQREDWPNFQWDSEALLQPIANLMQLHGELMGRMSMLGFDDKGEICLQALSDELIHSSEIEGVVLNADSVRSSIARKLGIKLAGELVEDHYVEGLVGVMLDAVSNCNAPLTAHRLFGWHAALFPTGRSGMYKITVANWRVGEEPMQVVSGALGHDKVHFEAPPSAVVPDEMNTLIKWCNSAKVSPIIKSAIAHLWFVTVHPFDDGNGRLSRTLADMYLAKLDNSHMHCYSMSAEINRHKKSYYDVLERTQKGSLDVTEWLLWFCNCLHDAVVHSAETMKRVVAKSLFWEKHRNTPLNNRQHTIINRLWDGFDGKLTSSKWAKITHCSQDTALRDINDLIAKNILCESQSAGRSKHYLLLFDLAPPTA